jgi:putative transposase
MKYAFMQAHATKFSIERMSNVLGVSRSGYYRFIHAVPSKRAQEDERLLVKMKSIYKDSRDTYGSPRIHAALREDGELCSRKRASKIMKQAGIIAKMKKRFKITTCANPKAAVAPNLLQQNFIRPVCPISAGSRILPMFRQEKVGYM